MSRPPHARLALLWLLLPPQAEHGPDSQAVLVALPGVDVEAIAQEVDHQCSLLPRADMTRRALSHSCIVQVASKEEAAQFSNRWGAPPGRQLAVRGAGAARAAGCALGAHRIHSLSNHSARALLFSASHRPALLIRCCCHALHSSIRPTAWPRPPSQHNVRSPPARRDAGTRRST